MSAAGWVAWETALHIDGADGLTVHAAAVARTPVGTAPAAFVAWQRVGDDGAPQHVRAWVCKNETVGRYLAEHVGAGTAFGDAAWVDGKVKVAIEAKKKSKSRATARVRFDDLDLRVRAEGFGPLTLQEEAHDGDFTRRGLGHPCARASLKVGDADRASLGGGTALASPSGLWKR